MKTDADGRKMEMPCMELREGAQGEEGREAEK